MNHFRPIDSDNGFLMPPSVDEWLPDRHLARFVVKVIAGLDVRAMTGSYRGSGEAPYHPRLLRGMLVYGYATDVFSSRKLERATYDSVAFRFVAANQHPDALPQAECYRTQSVASCKMLPGQRNAGCISSIGLRPSCELAAVLTWLNPAARRLRRWPAARVDPGCARRRDEPWPGRRNGAQPNRETPSRSARRVTFSVRQPVTELREATRHTAATLTFPMTHLWKWLRAREHVTTLPFTGLEFPRPCGAGRAR